MTSFSVVPFEDIKTFLTINKKSITSQPYLDAWNLINTSDNLISVPSSIADFFLASTLSHADIETYKLSQILVSSDLKNAVLKDLPKERVIRILNYLNKIENDMTVFSLLPQDISKSIVNDLDLNSVQLICEISDNFSKFCNTHLQPLLRKGLKGKTLLNIDNYNMKQLVYLSRSYQYNKINPGYYHSLMLENGKIKQYPYLEDIVQISSSDDHCVILSSEGEIYSFGSNNLGQLGLKHNYNCDFPQLIKSLSDIIQLSVSNTHSLALKINGEVYAFGHVFGNVPTLITKDIAQISAGIDHSLLLSIEGKVYVLHEKEIKLFETDTIIINITTGNNHSLMLDSAGKVYSYGNNSRGQLGLGNNIENVDTPTIIDSLYDIVHLIAGNEYSLVLDVKGNAYEFGIKEDKINYVPCVITIPNLLKP